MSSPRKVGSLLTCERSSRLHLQSVLGILLIADIRVSSRISTGLAIESPRTSEASSTAECAPSDSVTRTESSFDELFDRSYTSKLLGKGTFRQLRGGKKGKGDEMQTHET